MLGVLAFGMCVSSLLFAFVHSYAFNPPPGLELQDDLVRIRGSRTAGADGRVYRTFSEDEMRAYRALTAPFASVSMPSPIASTSPGVTSRPRTPAAAASASS